MTAHWGVADPAAVQGSDEQKARAFMDAAVLLKRRIELMLSLPMSTLTGLSLQSEIDRIGRTGG
jgi:arsenate reductase